jgi:hypothetical protein
MDAHLNDRDGLYFGGQAMQKKVKLLWPQLHATTLSAQNTWVNTELGPLKDIAVIEDLARREYRATAYEWSPIGSGTRPILRPLESSILRSGRTGPSCSPPHGLVFDQGATP